jgi:hypothetical protein
VVSVRNSIVCRLDQAKEQGDRKEYPEAIEPVPDFWLNPSPKSEQILHCKISDRAGLGATKTPGSFLPGVF